MSMTRPIQIAMPEQLTLLWLLLCTGIMPDKKQLALVFGIDKGKWQSLATANAGCTSQHCNPSLPLPSGSQPKSLAAFKRSSSSESGTDAVPMPIHYIIQTNF
jgi:hypothetical protein